MSDQGVPIEEISRLVGHKSTGITELVYRKQIRPVIQSGAAATDVVVGDGSTADWLADAEEPDSDDPESGSDLG